MIKIKRPIPQPIIDAIPILAAFGAAGVVAYLTYKVLKFDIKIDDLDYEKALREQ